MAAFFTGYLAQGTGNTAGFVENTASGYARVAVTMTALANGNCSMASPVGFTAQANTTVTQRALYDASSGGNLIMWWNLSNPVTVLSGASDNLKAGSLSHTFPDLYNGLGTVNPVDFLKGRKIGTTADGNPLMAGHYLEVSGGSIAAASSV